MLVRCSRCKELKKNTIEDFKSDKRYKDGLSTTCRVCDTRYNTYSTRPIKRSNEQWKQKQLNWARTRLLKEINTLSMYGVDVTLLQQFVSKRL